MKQKNLGREAKESPASTGGGGCQELDSLGECVMVLSPDDADSEARIVIPGLFAQDEDGTREYLCCLSKLVQSLPG